MKTQRLIGMACAGSAICAAAALLIPLPLLREGGIERLPLAPIGAGLRALSLRSAAGNGLAIALYVLVCCLPLVLLGLLWRRKKAGAEDILLPVMSGYLFFAVYQMINPAGMLEMGFTEAGMGKIVLGVVFWSLLSGWAVLRVLRRVRQSDSQRVLRLLELLTAVAAACVLFFIAFVHVVELRLSMDTLQSGNTATLFSLDPLTGNIIETDGLMPDKAFLVFRYLAGQIPAVLDVLILFSAGRLVRRLRKDRYGAEVVGACGALAGLCKKAVVITVVSVVAVNLLQLAFAGSLRQTDYTVNVPLFSVILALSMMLLSRYLAEGRAIKQENEQFV